MITRAHIRRQLRASGGITSLTPREGYFLGSIVRGAKKAIGKVADVAKQVVKSPIGKAALLGLGASYLGPKIMSGGGLKSFFGAGSFNPLRSIVERGPTRIASQSGLGKLLGKVGLTTETGGITGLSKMLGAGGLIGYFTSKGASEEEAEELAKDVYRGEGIGFDQIRKDIAAYRGGGLDASQMTSKGYRFLTPRNFVAKDGGSPNMKMAEIPKGLTYNDAVKTFTLSNGRKPKDVQEVIDFFKNRKLSAQGGRIGYASGSGTLANYSDDIVNEYKENVKEGYKGSIKKYILEFYGPEYLKPMAQGGRIGKLGGGIMNMPMGNMRRNRAGVMERDYRDEGGFVPVGVKEKADDVPAMLSKNEFVMTADAVRGAGDGNIKKGAQRMYDLMKRNEGKVA